MSDEVTGSVEPAVNIIETSPDVVVPPTPTHLDTRVFMQQLVRDRLSKHLANVKRLLKRHLFSEATVELSKAIFLAPQDPHLYIQRAKILSFLGDFSEAITNYQKALVIARQINHPDTLQLVRRIAHVMMFQGRVWLEQGQIESAIYHFEQGIAVDRTNGMLWIYLSLAHFNNKDFTKALARLTEYIEHVAGNNPFPFVLILRCRIYLLMDQIELAHKDFARAKAVDPSVTLLKRIESHFMRRGNSLFHEATVHLISLRYEQALKLLNTSIVIDPNDPKRYMMRATTHRQLEKFENALEDLKEASLRTPANERSEIIKQTALTFNDIALKHQSLGNTEQAIAYINQAAILDPKVPGFFINRGDFHRSLDPPRLAHALADYQKANELSRDDPQILFRISLIHHAFGLQLFNKRDYFSSETEFSLAIQHWTQVAMYYVNRGNCYFYTQNYTLALADFRAALKLDPDNVEARAKVEALAGNFPDQPQARSNASGHNQEAAAHAAWLASCNFGDSRVLIDVDAVEADRLELLKLRLQERTAAAGVHALYADRPRPPRQSITMTSPTGDTARVSPSRTSPSRLSPSRVSPTRPNPNTINSARNASPPNSRSVPHKSYHAVQKSSPELMQIAGRQSHRPQTATGARKM